jgi:hypothetical protein
MAMPSKKPAAPALGDPAKTPEESDAVAEALEIAFGKKLTPEQVAAFCLAAAMGVEKHAAGEY